MERQGAEVRIYTPKCKDDLFGGMPRRLDVEEVRVPVPPVFDLYYDLLLAKRLVSAASKWADVAILHDGQPVASYSMRRFRVLCIPFFHGDKWDWNLFGDFRTLAPIYTYPLNSLLSRCLQEVPIVFTNSRSLAAAVSQHEPRTNVVPISIGVDTSRFYPKWDEDRGFVMMAGRLHPVNNFEMGISALLETNYEMVIAGIVEPKSVWYYKHLREMVSSNSDLRGRVAFKSLTERSLIEHYQSCSLFLSPRVFDYLGRAALEPMACGKPVIASMTRSPVEDDPPVLLCRNNAGEWRDKVRGLMSDRATRMELGRKSYEFVESKHSLRTSATQMLLFMARLTEDREAERPDVIPSFA